MENRRRFAAGIRTARSREMEDGRHRPTRRAGQSAASDQQAAGRAESPRGRGVRGGARRPGQPTRRVTQTARPEDGGPGPGASAGTTQAAGQGADTAGLAARDRSLCARHHPADLALGRPADPQADRGDDAAWAVRQAHPGPEPQVRQAAPGVDPRQARRMAEDEAGGTAAPCLFRGRRSTDLAQTAAGGTPGIRSARGREVGQGQDRHHGRSDRGAEKGPAAQARPQRTRPLRRPPDPGDREVAGQRDVARDGAGRAEKTRPPVEGAARGSRAGKDHARTAGDGVSRGRQ